MGYSGTWGKLIHEKYWSRKSRDTVPLRRYLRLLSTSVVSFMRSGVRGVSWARIDYNYTILYANANYWQTLFKSQELLAKIIISQTRKSIKQAGELRNKIIWCHFTNVTF